MLKSDKISVIVLYIFSDLGSIKVPDFSPLLDSDESFLTSSCFQFGRQKAHHTRKYPRAWLTKRTDETRKTNCLENHQPFDVCEKLKNDPWKTHESVNLVQLAW